MLIATLAIAGTPASPDFSARTKFSKPQSGRTRIPFSGLLGVVTAGLTSFYMFRLMFLTFFGKERYDEHHVHVHESPQEHAGSAGRSGGPLRRRRLDGRAASVGRRRIISSISWRRSFIGGRTGDCRASGNLRGGADIVQRSDRRAGDRRASRLAAGLVALHSRVPKRRRSLAQVARAVRTSCSTENITSTKFMPRVIVRPLVWISDKCSLARGGRRRDRRHRERRRARYRANRATACATLNPATRAATPPGSFWARVVFTSLLLWMVG